MPLPSDVQDRTKGVTVAGSDRVHFVSITLLTAWVLQWLYNPLWTASYTMTKRVWSTYHRLQTIRYSAACYLLWQDNKILYGLRTMSCDNGCAFVLIRKNKRHLHFPAAVVRKRGGSQTFRQSLMSRPIIHTIRHAKTRQQNHIMICWWGSERSWIESCLTLSCNFVSCATWTEDPRRPISRQGMMAIF